MDALSLAAALAGDGWRMLALGLWFGLVHALDADHLATLGSLAANDRGVPPTRYALRWALGHAAALVLAAAAVVAFGLPGVAAAGGYAELAVACVLLALGAQALRGSARIALPVALPAPHAQGSKGALGAAFPLDDGAARRARRGLWIGLLHGGAGSAAVLALLPLATLDGLAASALYLACFSAGVAAGALAFAHGCARLLRAAAGQNGGRILKTLQAAAGAAAVAAGVWLLWELFAAPACAAGGC
ncbi:MAG TPA: hypothetical protein VIN61_01990 [Gammaproteobacteria bacterium]